MKQVYLFRSYLIEGDSRTQKMLADYHANGFNIKSVVWTRGSAALVDASTTTFTGKGLLGGRLGNAYYFLKWHLFIANFLLSIRREKALIHCIDFDTAVVCVPLARLLRKPVIYDAFDHFASSRDFTGAGFSFMHRLERALVRAASVCILPDEARRPQYGLPAQNGKGDNVRVIGNIPAASSVVVAAASTHTDASSSQPLKLCYVGTLEARHRGLEFIPELCKALGNKVKFTVAGIGELDDYFRSQAEGLPNLHYLGSLPYDRALQVMGESDLLYGPYLLTSKNHIFASPNKMYEHMLLGKGMITNTGTPVAEFVTINKTGILFDGGFQDLVRVVESVDMQRCRELGRVARNLWDGHFCTLRARQVDAYFSTVARLG